MGSNNSTLSGKGAEEHSPSFPKPDPTPSEGQSGANNRSPRPSIPTLNTSLERPLDRQPGGPAQPSKSHGQVLGVQLSPATREWISSHRTTVATMLASVASTSVAYPLDFVKARMQSYNTPFRAVVRDSFVNEGIRGMYKGCMTPIYTITAVRMVSFSTYNTFKHWYDDIYKAQFGISPLDLANAKGQYPNLHTFTCFFVSGSVGGAIIPFMAAPFELMKLKAQLAGKMARDSGKPISQIKTGTFGPARDMVKEHGIFSLWKGFRLHFVRDTLGTAIYFSVYETVKQIMGVAHGREPTDGVASMTAGLATGALSWIIIYPIDVRKTQYQKRYLSGEVATSATKHKVEYFTKAGYRGLGVSVARSALVNAFFFPIFEQCKKAVHKMTPKRILELEDDDEDDDDID